MDNTPLSDREIEILKLVSQGKSNKEIAADLFISINTVKVHVGNIFQKINVSSRTEATLYAIEHGIIKSPSGNNGEVEVLVPAPAEVQGGEPTRAQKLWKKYWGLFAVIGLAGILGLSSWLVNTSMFASPTATPNAYVSALNPVRWQELAPMLHARASMAVATYDNAIYAIGGETDEGPSRLVEKYDPQTDTWNQLQDKPTAVSDVSAVVLGEKLYLPGGKLADGSSTNLLEVYDPRKDTWEHKANMPQAISAYALAAYEGQMYLFGGWDGEKVVDTVFRYDPLGNSWYQVSSMPTARASSGAEEVDGKIYIIGGWDGEKALGVTEIYNPSREGEEETAWSKAKPIPEAVSGFGIQSIAEIIYVTGKEYVRQYIPQQDNWAVFNEESPVLNCHNSSLETIGGYLYLLGGKTKDGEILNDNFRYQAVFTIVFPLINK